MKDFIKCFKEFFYKSCTRFVREILVPLLISTYVECNFGLLATILTVMFSSAIWSMWLTVLEAPGESLKWKLKWFKEPPDPYIIDLTAHRAFETSFLISLAMFLDKLI